MQEVGYTTAVAHTHTHTNKQSYSRRTVVMSMSEW